MPRLSQIIVRTALLWLGLGYTAGGLALLAKGVAVPPWLWSLRTSHVHMLLVGWTVQLAFGVAYWILPRLDAAGARGDSRPVWLSYAALNAGVVLAALPGPLAALGSPAPAWLPVAAAAAQLLAVAAFVAHAWRRVLPFRAFPPPGPPPQA